MENILNIYLIIENDYVKRFRAVVYKKSGSDEEKIEFLKKRAKEDFETATKFNAPINARGRYMTYRQFSKLEKQGMHYRLFEGIFDKFDVPQNPLICVTPFYNGQLLGE